MQSAMPARITLPCRDAMCCLKLESVGPGLMRRAVYYTTGKEPVEGYLPLGINLGNDTD